MSMSTSTRTDAELRYAIAAVSRIEQAGLWKDFQEDLRQRMAEAESPNMETLGQKFYREEIAARVARLFGVPQSRVEGLTADALMKTRHNIVMGALADYLHEIATCGGRRPAKDWLAELVHDDANADLIIQGFMRELAAETGCKTAADFQREREEEEAIEAAKAARPMVPQPREAAEQALRRANRR